MPSASEKKGATKRVPVYNYWYAEGIVNQFLERWGRAAKIYWESQGISYENGKKDLVKIFRTNQKLWRECKKLIKVNYNVEKLR